MDIARRIYLQEPSLRAIDTDIMQVPKSLYPSTRIRGADAYNRIWPEIFENIEYFRNLQVENLEVEINGDLALTTFDAPGHGRLRGKPKFSSYKNFTLLWQQTPDGWRIFHEHISDGRK
jgi:ketosteroid isomerase-like protein